MRDWIHSRAARLLALATLMWLTVGLHLIHPWVHEHACHPGQMEMRASRAAPGTQPAASGALVTAGDADDDDDCCICAFLYTFHAHNPAPPPGAIFSDAAAAAAAFPAFLLPAQSCSSPFGARAPPS